MEDKRAKVKQGMTFRRYLRVSALGMVGAIGLLTLSVMLRVKIDGSFFEELIDTVAGFLLILPILLLPGLGRTKARQVGPEKVARLQIGSRLFYGLFFGGGAATVAFVLLMAPREGGDAEVLYGVFLALIGLFALHAFFVAATARASWDQTKISATTFLGASHERRWEDLRHVYDDGGQAMMANTILKFEDGLKLRIYRSYDGHDEIVACARSRLNA